MKKILWLCALVCLGIPGHGETMKSQSSSPVIQQAKSLDRRVSERYKIKYLLFLPKGYHPKQAQRWPLIMFLHGLGERGDNLELVKIHGPPKNVEKQPDFPFILVSPQCPLGQWWSSDVLNVLLDEVIAKNKVDTNRIYLTGLSMGGFGTWALALQNPERFAAIAPICGGGNPFPPFGFDPHRAQALKTLGIWVFHGAKDTVVPVSESERMIKAMEVYGCQDVQSTFYPDANHDSWTETYNNPKLYEWFLHHARPGSGSKKD